MLLLCIGNAVLLLCVVNVLLLCVGNAVSGFMYLWCSDVKYSGLVFGVLSGVHHRLIEHRLD
jgi:hypothetical protein